jgi:hypothetical protein
MIAELHNSAIIFLADGTPVPLGMANHQHFVFLTQFPAGW